MKLTPEEIVVLSNPCVSLYSYSHQLIREIIPCGEKKNHLIDSFSIHLSTFLSLIDYLIVSVHSLIEESLYTNSGKKEIRKEILSNHAVSQSVLKEGL